MTAGAREARRAGAGRPGERGSETGERGAARGAREARRASAGRAGARGGKLSTVALTDIIAAISRKMAL
ncbi:hypothetical protein LBW89_11395 [Paenibacillus sp. alder61]|uniref:hypothetical protein n=1 Tax=Paenibacillus TaxID=44249 RepID=UPI0014789957|nr:MULTISPECIES: hypothetical protein [Paenibacillus]MCA1293619.1 hypothetical protein [Paenibacillus sp. alder61]